MLGMGDYPETEEQIDPDFTNPGKVYFYYAYLLFIIIIAALFEYIKYILVFNHDLWT